MKDRYIVAIIAAGFLAWFAVIHFFLIDRRPWSIDGAPAHAQCSHDDKTCVADGVAYTCVWNYRSRVIACGQRSDR